MLPLASCIAPVVVGGGGEETETDDPGTGTAGAGCDAARPGPAMVQVVTPNGTPFCIDTTEVTAAQYAVFLDSAPQPDPTDAVCYWKNTFAPGEEPADLNHEDGGPGSCQTTNTYFDPSNRPDDPVRCVDWCDAATYCKWAGKHLCGLLGPSSGDNNVDDSDPNNSEWFSACSNGGLTRMPYGDERIPGWCNDGAGPADVMPVGAAAACHGIMEPYFSIHDMSGNVDEWSTTCRTEEPENVWGLCRLHGGSYREHDSEETTTIQLSCAKEMGHSYYLTRNYETPQIGFRCCAEP